jgi:hypothetical protein
MPLRYSLFLLLTLGLYSAAYAQQPFARFGVKVEVLSLSNGRYPEFFPNDSLRRVGSVVYNRRLHRIAYLLPPDSLLGRTKSEVTSRWWAVDPHAENYVNITPYAFVANNPVNNMDPDGRDIIYNASKPVYDKKTGVTTYNITVDISMKIMNRANMSQKEFDTKVSDFKSQLTNSLGGTFSQGKKNFVFTAGKMDIQGASEMKQVRSTDHLMVFVDDVTGKSDKGGPAGGQAPLNERIEYVETDQDAGGMIHEFGHSMGLMHNWRTPGTADDKAGNYMGYGSNRNSFDSSQLFDSYQTYKGGLLNQGGNSSTMPSPGMYTPGTTQSKPYRRANEGEKTPRQLPSL